MTNIQAILQIISIFQDHAVVVAVIAYTPFIGIYRGLALFGANTFTSSASYISRGWYRPIGEVSTDKNNHLMLVATC